ncbi:MAG: TldD/PmbA family protein [Spirochaetia bacterium]|nr:TldD/PmbA family protein [Spirochaetia bacterium]
MNDPTKITKSLRDIGAELLETLRPNGQNEIAAHYESRMRIIFEGNDYSVAAETADRVIGIRTIENGRMGFVSTNEANGKLSESAREAMDLAKLALPSDFHSIAPQNSSSITIENSLHLDPALLAMDPETAIKNLSILIEAATEDSRISIDRAEIGVQFSLNCVMNSNGLLAEWGISTLDWFAMGMAREGDQVTSFDYDGGTVRQLRGVEEALRKTGVDFKKGLIDSLNPQSGESYRGAVLLHPRAVSDLFQTAILTNCNARMHQDKTSAWTGKLGELIAHRGLNAFEDPTDLNRPEGWIAYDREGVRTSRHDLVKNGELQFLAHNCFTAKKGGVAPTGNARGSAGSIPAIGFSNPSFEAGPEISRIKDEGLLQAIPKALLLVRFSGNDDPISGEFSGVAKNSFWLENGVLRPAGEVMISGNLFEMLKNPLAASRAHQIFGGSTAPYMLVDGLSVTVGS